MIFSGTNPNFALGNIDSPMTLTGPGHLENLLKDKVESNPTASLLEIRKFLTIEFKNQWGTLPQSDDVCIDCTWSGMSGMMCVFLETSKNLAGTSNIVFYSKDSSYLCVEMCGRRSITFLTKYGDLIEQGFNEASTWNRYLDDTSEHHMDTLTDMSKGQSFKTHKPIYQLPWENDYDYSHRLYRVT